MKEKTKNELRFEAIYDVLPLDGEYGDKYFIVEENAYNSGEDVFIEIESITDDPATEILNAIKERIDGFSRNEYLDTYAPMRGENGVPETYEDLIDAGNECLDLYKEWYDDATKALKNVEKNQKEVLSILVENKENGREEWLKLPTTKELVSKLYEKIGIKNNDTQSIFIKSYESKSEGLERTINTRNLNEHESLNELNYLAHILDNGIDLEIFDAATSLDSMKDTKDLINLTKNLDKYTLHKNNEELGIYLVFKSNEIEIPENLKPLLDCEKYGREYKSKMYSAGMGIKTENGILIRNDYIKEFYKGVEDIPEEYKVIPTLKKTTSLADKFESKKSKEPVSFGKEEKNNPIMKM